MKGLDNLSVRISAVFIGIFGMVVIIPVVAGLINPDLLPMLEPIIVLGDQSIPIVENGNFAGLKFLEPLQPIIIASSVASIITGILVGRQISSPLTELTKAADQISSGETCENIIIKGSPEIKKLTQSFNRMAAKLEETKHKQFEMLQKLEELAITDDLTGLYNRRELNRLMEAEYKRAKRYNRPFSMIMLDIDHFKQYNDTFGHLFGDKVIKWVAKLIATNTRSTNYVARYGGDEFVILLPETTCIDAYWAAERIRKTIVGTPFCGKDNNGHPIQLSLTVSLGISELTNDIFSVGAFFSRTDQALYLSKNNGRDQVQAAAEKFQITANYESVN